MIKHFLILFFFVVSLNVFGQQSLYNSPRNLYYIGARTDKIMLFELGYMYLNGKHLNFQLKGSMRRNVNSELEFGLSKNSFEGTANFTSSYYFIKPGYILVKTKNFNNTFFLIINSMFSYSQNQLFLVINDPLFGETTQVNYDNQLITTMELELKWHVDMGKYVSLSLGSLIGVPLKEPDLFKDVYYGWFNNFLNYNPGSGDIDNVYLLLNLGLVFKPFN